MMIRSRRLGPVLVLSLALTVAFSGAALGHEETAYEFRGDYAYAGWHWREPGSPNVTAWIEVYEGIFESPGARGNSGKVSGSVVTMFLAFTTCANGLRTDTHLRGSTWFVGPAFTDSYRVAIGTAESPVTVALVGDTFSVTDIGECSGSSLEVGHKQVAEYKFTGQILAVPTVTKGRKTNPAGDPTFVPRNVNPVQEPNPGWSGLEWIIGPDLGAHEEDVQGIGIGRWHQSIFLHDTDPPA